MEASMVQQIQELYRLRVGQLREKYLEVFGEASRSCNKAHLQKRIAWRLQALAEGGLSERARRRAEELADDADLRVRSPRVPISRDVAAAMERSATSRLSPSRDPRLPLPGTLLVREFRGRDVVVKVLDQDFEFENRRYPSLSAIAKEVTGSQWNGFLFFGIAGGDTGPQRRTSR